MLHFYYFKNMSVVGSQPQSWSIMQSLTTEESNAGNFTLPSETDFDIKKVLS